MVKILTKKSIWPQFLETNFFISLIPLITKWLKSHLNVQNMEEVGEERSYPPLKQNLIFIY